MSSTVLVSKETHAEISSILLNKLKKTPGFDVRRSGDEILNLFFHLLSGMFLFEQNKTHLSKLMRLFISGS